MRQQTTTCLLVRTASTIALAVPRGCAAERAAATGHGVAGVHRAVLRLATPLFLVLVAVPATWAENATIFNLSRDSLFLCRAFYVPYSSKARDLTVVMIEHWQVQGWHKIEPRTATSSTPGRGSALM